jgi:probable HAF family extracellular repeat protein
MTPRLRLAVGLAALASFATPSLLAQDSVIDIDPLGTGTSLLFAVNNRGQAVGRAELGSSDNVRAILWQDGQLTDLGALPDYPQSGAAAINERGQIVGYVANFDVARAVLWNQGRIIDLTPPGWTSCFASAINNPGDIVGTCSLASGLTVAVLWRGGTMRTLDPLPGYLASSASDINDSGVVVGTLTNYLDERSSAFRWTDGTMSTLPLPPGTANASASAINARGTIVGTATGPIGASPQPVIWRGGAVVSLGDTWGSVLGSAWGINDRGDVVGMTFAISGFVWSAGTFKSLESPYGSFPQGISERGDAVGFIFTAGGIPLHGAVWPKALTRIAPRDPRDVARP